MTHLCSDILSELICTRLSHDLIGNIGAVSNAVELMEDDDSFAEVKPLLETSAFTLSARLKFFRSAFGLSNATPRQIEQVCEIAQNYLLTIGHKNTPISLDFQAKTPALHKMILLAVMMLADVFIRGGKLQVLEKVDGLFVSAQSERALSAPKLKALDQALQGIIPEDNPAQVAPAAYLHALLDVAGVGVKLEYTEKSATLKVG